MPKLSVAAAWPVTFPAAGELKVIVHCPAAFVFAPAVVHEPVGAVCAAPFESVSATSTCSPAAGTNVPLPVSFSSVTVNVCECPTSFVALGAIEIRAAAMPVHVFVASLLSPACVSPVARVRDTPPTDTVVVAWIVQSLIFWLYLRYLADYRTAAGSLLGFYFLTTYIYVAAIVLLVGIELDEQLRKDVEGKEDRGIIELVRGIL